MEDINRDLIRGPLEFFTPGHYEGKIEPTYVRSQTWKSPRMLITHVLEEFLPKQLREGKGKVSILVKSFMIDGV